MFKEDNVMLANCLEYKTVFRKASLRLQLPSDAVRTVKLITQNLCIAKESLRIQQSNCKVVILVLQSEAEQMVTQYRRQWELTLSNTLPVRRICWVRLTL
jgi:hypothetical protein